jgi:hypothetical protein
MRPLWLEPLDGLPSLDGGFLAGSPGLVPAEGGAAAVASFPEAAFLSHKAMET